MTKKACRLRKKSVSCKYIKKNHESFSRATVCVSSHSKISHRMPKQIQSSSYAR